MTDDIGWSKKEAKNIAKRARRKEWVKKNWDLVAVPRTLKDRKVVVAEGQVSLVFADILIPPVAVWVGEALDFDRVELHFVKDPPLTTMR